MIVKDRKHGAADPLEWNEAMNLINRLYRDGRYRDSLLVGCGCFFGLRISDLLTLKWEDILGKESFVMGEEKTGKERRIKINSRFASHIRDCWKAEGEPLAALPVFGTRVNMGFKPMSRQRAFQLLKEIQERYGVRSARNFSTHSLRKTFGRKVYDNACGQGRGEFALLLLKRVFRHSNASVTERYLGIRNEEIESVYDELEF